MTLKLGTIVLFGLVLADVANSLMCMKGSPNAPFSVACADGVTCCTETVDGPSRTYDCAAYGAECDADKSKKKYRISHDWLDYDAHYTLVCGADNCNTAGGLAKASFIILIPSVLALLYR